MSAALASLRFAPDFRLQINGAPAPAELRASIIQVTHTSGLQGADRVELTLVNDGLRWLDNPLFALDTSLVLAMGYADSGTEQVFVGQVVGFSADFPAASAPTVTVTAQDARYRMAQGTKVRWFAIPIPSVGNFPLPDLATAAITSLENLLIPIIDPVGAALSILLGGAEAATTISDPGGAQKFIRKQASESDYDFLTKLAKENGWEMLVDHSGPLGGHLIKDPLTLATAPRRLISELIPKLNQRLTATGSALGDPGIQAGNVLRIKGVGVQFGGLWRVTEATHTIDGGGYHTHFKLRKEIWFGSIPSFAQGAVPIRASF